MNRSSQKRAQIIQEVLADLHNFQETAAASPNQYGINETIVFFEAVKSLPRYIQWLVQRAPKLDRTRLIELTDLPFPKWDALMHERLMELERAPFPGLIRPLVHALVDLAARRQGQSSLRFCNFGCGGMEVERQVIEQLSGRSYPQQAIFVGIDNSPVAPGLAEKNLKPLIERGLVQFQNAGRLEAGILEEVSRKKDPRFVVVLCNNDIFTVDRDVPPQTFDVVFHSLFKHHLTESQQVELEALSLRVGKKVMEYDGYRNWFFICLPHSLTAWNDPAFLDATIFSDLRYKSKRELRKKFASDRKWKPSFSNIATYLNESIS